MCNVYKIFWEHNVLSDKVNARGKKKCRFFTMGRSVEIQQVQGVHLQVYNRQIQLYRSYRTILQPRQITLDFFLNVSFIYMRLLLFKISQKGFLIVSRDGRKNTTSDSAAHVIPYKQERLNNIDSYYLCMNIYFCFILPAISYIYDKILLGLYSL